MRSWSPLLALCLLTACVSPAPGTGLAGVYRLDAGPDVAGRLVLGADGRFTYMLAAGALDEHAHGRWEAAGDAACLTTEPKPVPPAFSVAPGGDGHPGEATLLVTWPNGGGIAGVDFRLSFADGSAIEDYTQYDGWTLPEGDARTPQWVELAEPVHGVTSPRFELGRPGPWRFVLTPNSLGVVDFEGSCLRPEGDAYQLQRNGGPMRFIRTRR